ncbi:PAS domain-containing protein [Candidatus Sumerlaeota bacterium]|nr:PAS domain-containing protein [Candidatus Sumerlaeota bacterium]
MRDPKILLAEDEPTLARKIRGTLTRSGYTVLPLVASGEDAVDRAREQHPDLVLLDVAVGGKVGAFEAADAIGLELGVPVVFLTSRGDSVTVDRAASSEAAIGLIQEPEESGELLAIVGLAVGKCPPRGSRSRSVARAQPPLDAASDGEIPMAALALDGRLIETNAAFEQLLGASPGEHIGRPLADILRPADSQRYWRRVAELFDGERLFFRSDAARLLNTRGRTVVVDLSAFPVQDSKGETRVCVEASPRIAAH